MIDRFIDVDDGFYSKKECRCCLEKEQTMDHAANYLEAIVKQLYNKETLDAFHLEYCLDELCHLMGVKTIAGDLQVQRKVEKPAKNIQYWVDFLKNEMKQYEKIEKIA